ncbi:hypothetical protein HQ496_13235 [bacterium]|nr:hypothetical protein [bacterium]
MKYGLLILLVAILGIGEFAFVEYYPASPIRRSSMLHNLPVIGKLMKHQEAIIGADFRKKLIEDAESGNPLAAYFYYMYSSEGSLDRQRGLELLRSSETATAKWILGKNIDKNLDANSREGLLIYAQQIQEHYRISYMTHFEDEHNRRVAEAQLAQLQRSAENGDEDAQWVVDQLAINKRP